ncbi:DUF3052 domain-containing protein [Arthrobacter rhombi]|uniref:DUF3052 domain-containing protein n=1 Tax=Arthrobacter rhombi TaxID=71253 RepID=A0A1R4G6V8_9MICC|nr:DUF3052 domain-containing protein [Arthrobacter rhombi]SJM63823.1 hypothetical protein FM101_08105 [Arthrobacter rhombi]
MSDAGAAKTAAVEKMGFKDGDLIQELGYDDDVDDGLRDTLEEVTGHALLAEDEHEVVDGVLLWWREGEGDLVDDLVDSLTTLDEGGVIWLMTPKSGRDGFVGVPEIQEAAPTAGLHVTSSEGVSEDWTATRLVGRRKN